MRLFTKFLYCFVFSCYLQNRCCEAIECRECNAAMVFNDQAMRCGVSFDMSWALHVELHVVLHVPLHVMLHECYMARRVRGWSIISILGGARRWDTVHSPATSLSHLWMFSGGTQMQSRNSSPHSAWKREEFTMSKTSTSNTSAKTKHGVCLWVSHRLENNI